MRVAVYPGSFDPVTNGHLDVIRRAAGAFDRLVVAVLRNPRKSSLLDVETRQEVLRAAVREAGLPTDRVTVESFEGLTVDFCHARGAAFIVRGLRAISDFEVEMQLAHNNRRLAPDVDTVFFMTDVEHGFVSSTMVREIAGFGASGRNGGWCYGGLPGSRSRLVRAHGKDAVMRYERACFETIDVIGATLAREGIDAHFHKGGWSTLAMNPVGLAHAQIGRAHV